jgi:hypothetical protein
MTVYGQFAAKFGSFLQPFNSRNDDYSQLDAECLHEVNQANGSRALKELKLLSLHRQRIQILLRDGNIFEKSKINLSSIRSPRGQIMRSGRAVSVSVCVFFVVSVVYVSYIAFPCFFLCHFSFTCRRLFVDDCCFSWNPLLRLHRQTV